jgi:hypothetical protein
MIIYELYYIIIMKYMIYDLQYSKNDPILMKFTKHVDPIEKLSDMSFFLPSCDL